MFDLRAPPLRGPTCGKPDCGTYVWFVSFRLQYARLPLLGGNTTTACSDPSGTPHLEQPDAAEDLHANKQNGERPTVGRPRAAIGLKSAAFGLRYDQPHGWNRRIPAHKEEFDAG